MGIKVFDVEQNRVDTLNETRAADDGTGIQCDTCKNRGYIAFLSEDKRCATRACSCQAKRVTVQRMKDQCLFDRIKSHTLEKYVAKTDTQKALKRLTIDYIKDPDGHWLALCGAPGVGKTHLSTAAFVWLCFRKSLRGRYFLWNSDGRRVKLAAADGNDAPLNEVKKCDILYIDDLFKTKKGSDPSDADVRLCFEILDYRYAQKLPTIISTEMLSSDIADLDFALFRRIKEMCGRFIADVEPDTNKCFFPDVGS